MKCILLSVLFLPFTALATPVSSGLPSAASSSARIYKLPGLVDSGTSENGADANDPKEPEYCPVPKPGPHITPIDIGASPFTVSRLLNVVDLLLPITYRLIGHGLLRR